MAIVKGFATNNLSWKDNFFFVRLDEATVAEECLPVFKRSWGRRGNGTDRFINPSLSDFLGLIHSGKSSCSGGALPIVIWSFNRGRRRAIRRGSHPVRFSRIGAEWWSGIVWCYA
ncbi:hypothetical protein F2Q70_00042322 [Brassica cretica]|uniref:Uncharacterized protein n=1 Tax=Brassica cretica TaxID=69181 RepID=A0A8S9KER0_BRACR|nr:hypothetical protein F2Q70_00042322 [Brassica cretica]